MYNLLPKTKKNGSDIHKHRITRGLMVSATMGAWALLILAVVWSVAAIGWYLLTRTWRQELFVPGAVFSTVGAGVVTLFWAVLLSCIALLWANYHYQRYHKNNRRQLSPLIMRSEQLSWQEFIMDSSRSCIPTPIQQGFAETAATLESTACNHEHCPEQSLITGTALQEDFRDEKGRIVLRKGEVVTSKIIETMTARGLYGQYWKQRKRWAQGGWHLLRTHKDIFKDFRYRYLYPAYLETVLSFFWSFVFVFGTS